MRVATAGLAASESTMPVMISTAMAASISRSTVHHQLANRVRSTREIMRGSGREKRPTVASHGLRMINGSGSVELQHRIPERGAADLEVAVLVIGGAGGREQHHGLLRLGRRGILCGKLDRALERAGHDERPLALQRAREFARRFADQKGLADAREVAGE